VDGVQQAVASREMIAVTRLTKRFGTQAAPVVALSNIEFRISEGELVVVVGPSGCGKSTLLRILAGLLPQSEGEARLHGTPIGGPRRDIGVVFQSPVLFPWRSVLGNALPYIFAGLEIAMIFALIGAIVGEFVGAQAGLGMLIQSMNFTMDVAGQFSILLILSMVGLILNTSISMIRKRLLFWDPSSRQAGNVRLQPASKQEALVCP